MIFSRFPEEIIEIVIAFGEKRKAVSAQRIVFLHFLPESKKNKNNPENPVDPVE